MSQRNMKVSLKPGKSRAALTTTHPNAAGIDIGSASHFVAGWTASKGFRFSPSRFPLSQAYPGAITRA